MTMRGTLAFFGLLLSLASPLALGQLTIGGEAAKPPAAQAVEPSQPTQTQPTNTPSEAGPAPSEAEASTSTAPADGSALAEQVEALKEAVLNLNRDLLILEEELLFPANTQIAIYLSMDVGEFFALDAVEVKIDDKPVAASLYTPQQADALHRGGVQRLYVGNLKAGPHVVTAFFTGKGPEGRDYKRGATIVVEKQLSPKMVELRIVDSTRKLQPVFDIKEWEL